MESFMRIPLVFFAVMLCMLISSCSTITEKDLADLRSPNDIVKKGAIQRTWCEASFPLSLMGGLVNRVNEKRAVSLMAELLRRGKESKDVQLSIVKALGELGKRTEVPISPLLEKLKDKDPYMRAQAAEAIAKTKNEKASTALIKVLEEETDKYPIIWALGELGDQGAVPALNRLLASEDKYLKYNAFRALSKIETDEIEHDSDKMGLLDFGKIAYQKYQHVMLGALQRIIGLKRGEADKIKRSCRFRTPEWA
jgi:HEAT repeat protein